ncbi:MAG: aminopeptidase P family protein, partial [Clostridia bacterium]|nr:aminopeptidase P family protein [Clostridia bacterium]
SVDAEAVYTTVDYLKRYLTGFSFEDGYVVADRECVTVYTDARYIESAKKFFEDKGNGISVEEINEKNRASVLLKKYKSVAIPLALTSYPDYKKLEGLGVTLTDATPAFNACMAVKTAQELTYIRRACAVAEDAFLKLLPNIKEGMCEREVAALLEYEMRMLGADGTSFETIVAFGANASVPHHQTGNRKLCFGDEILIDFGCKVNGYCSDITRTFLFGDDKKHERFKKLYQEVLAAHRIFLENFRTGMTGKEGDALARDYLKSKNLAQYFTHSLGHGIGLNIHEEPRLSRLSQTVFQNGMVFSNEPGVYLEGELGIRIEDTVTLQDGKTVSFMHKTDKELVII